MEIRIFQRIWEKISHYISLRGKNFLKKHLPADSVFF